MSSHKIFNIFSSEEDIIAQEEDDIIAQEEDDIIAEVNQCGDTVGLHLLE